MKTGSKALALALLFVGLVLINYLATSLPVRLDLTAESIYSLSPGTRALLGKIEEPIALELYFSKDASGLPIRYKNYAVRVEEMLRQYVRAARGKLTLTVVYPQPDTPAEEQATAAGLTQQVSPQGGTPFFFGLVVVQADQQKTIPNFNPNREQFLEYDLSQVIHAVQQFDKRKLGLLTSLPLQGSDPQERQLLMMQGRQPSAAQMVIEELEQSFQIVRIEEAATTLPDNLDALAVIHPQKVAPRLQFAIDQFLLAGKPVFLAVDPSSQYFRRQGGQQAMFGGPQPNVASDLPTLLHAYGIAYDSQKVVGDLENAAQVQAAGGIVRYPVWLNLLKTNFSQQALPTAQLNSALFIEAGSIAPLAGSALTFTPVVETSAQTGELAGALLQFTQPDDLAKQLTPSGKKTIAALITGRFPTAFPDGAPAEAAKADPAQPTPPAPAPAGAALKASTTTSTLFLIADTDWLFDDYSVRKYNFFGQTAAEPINDNLALAANTLEYLGGAPELIAIRGKGSSLRPFTVVRQIELAAQKQYQDQLANLDARLKQVQTRLGELQGKKTEGNRLVASPEVQKAIDDFQKQSAQMRGERRKIRRALREDIDRLENWLLVLNLLATPLLVGGFGLWFYRQRKK